MLCLIALFFLFPYRSSATSIVPTPFEQVVRESEFVFQGTVVSVNTQMAPDTGAPETCASFNIIEIVKGSYPESAIQLCFAGGEVGGVGLRISDMRYPDLGEQGIYFVESLSRRQINPLFAWDQGRYLVVDDPLTQRKIMMTADKKIVKDVVPGTSADRALSPRTAVGVITSDESPAKKPLTAEEFKQQIQFLLGSAR